MTPSASKSHHCDGHPRRLRHARRSRNPAWNSIDSLSVRARVAHSQIHLACHLARPPIPPHAAFHLLTSAHFIITGCGFTISIMVAMNILSPMPDTISRVFTSSLEPSPKPARILDIATAVVHFNEARRNRCQHRCDRRLSLRFGCFSTACGPERDRGGAVWFRRRSGPGIPPARR